MTYKTQGHLRLVDQLQLWPVELGQDVHGKLPPANRAHTVYTLTYGVTVTVDATLGDVQRLVVTNGVAFTISAPKNPDSVQMGLTFEILNSSGGAMGAITWNALFKLAGAFVNPANTKTRTITFYFNGTNWIEQSRAAADI